MKRVCFVLSISLLLAIQSGFAQDQIGRVYTAQGMDVDVSECEGVFTREELYDARFAEIDFELDLEVGQIHFIKKGKKDSYGFAVYEDYAVISNEEKKNDACSLTYENGMPVVRFKPDGKHCYNMIIQFTDIKQNTEQ